MMGKLFFLFCLLGSVSRVFSAADAVSAEVSDQTGSKLQRLACGPGVKLKCRKWCTAPLLTPLP